MGKHVEQTSLASKEVREPSSMRAEVRHFIMSVQATFSEQIHMFAPVLPHESWESLTHMALEHYAMASAIRHYHSLKAVSGLAERAAPKILSGLSQTILQLICKYVREESTEIIALLHDFCYPTDVSFTEERAIAINHDFTGYQSRGSAVAIFTKLAGSVLKQLLGLDTFIDELVSGVRGMFTSESSVNTKSFHDILSYKLTPHDTKVKSLVSIAEAALYMRYGLLNSKRATPVTDQPSGIVLEQEF